MFGALALVAMAAPGASQTRPATAPPAANTAPPAANCAPTGLEFGREVEVLQAYRAFAGKDGASKVERVTLPGERGSYYGGTVKLTQFDLGDPTRVKIVYGYPNIYIPPHPAPYREIFVILSGSSEMAMPDGQTLILTPGTMFIADDVGVTKGRGGRAGPCGYVALDLQFSPPKLPPLTGAAK
jgi:hypothetical protein